jgi:hypothetical protein
VKTMRDIKQDMSDLYDEVRAGTTDLKQAAELSNIAGKFLKAEQLVLAREIFESARGIPTFPAANQLLEAGKRGGKKAA